jgi:hypothetical protein
MSAESDRVASFGGLEDGLRQASDWYLWGPYLSERQWGTVREDYSADGEAWNYLPHDHARSQAYRWGEDGLAGFCDIEQRLCLGLALWNGRDPILKERIFGLTGAEANHGEDAKEYWWYLDALPSHAWNRWRYHYPQAAFPYDNLRAENGRRGKLDPEYEFLDTGVFDGDRYWITEVCYAKAEPTDLLMAITVTNAGPDTDTLHVLPTAWFRNTWSWDLGAAKPVMAATGAAAARVEHPYFGALLWSKQLYYYDVSRWLDGDPAQPPPPAARRFGRNSRWRNFNAFDIMSMPDKWEYPWFAAWDLAFHCVALAHVDPAFAKYQLILLCREWFQHPNGALPAYEWDFSDTKLFDEAEFLSPYGLRAVSAYHRDHPYQLEAEGLLATIDYEPAESTTDMFGGNSNWRGPLWFPLNYLVSSSLERYHRFFGDDLTVEYPTGSGQRLPLGTIVTDLQDRLISIFLVGPDGRRPCFGWVERLQHDPAWKDNLVFNEYFHGDNGAGLGAAHQTGWTGLIADLIRRRHGAVRAVGDVIRDFRTQALRP